MYLLQPSKLMCAGVDSGIDGLEEMRHLLFLDISNNDITDSGEVVGKSLCPSDDTSFVFTKTKSLRVDCGYNHVICIEKSRHQSSI